MPSLELTPAVHYWHSPPPPKPLQHPFSPDSVLLKMKAVHSFETSEHTSSTWHINPKDNHQRKHFTHIWHSACCLHLNVCEYEATIGAKCLTTTKKGRQWNDTLWFGLFCSVVVDTTASSWPNISCRYSTFVFFVICTYTSCIIHLISKYLLCRQTTMLHVAAGSHVTFGTRWPCYIW